MSLFHDMNQSNSQNWAKNYQKQLQNIKSRHKPCQPPCRGSENLVLTLLRRNQYIFYICIQHMHVYIIEGGPSDAWTTSQTVVPALKASGVSYAWSMHATAHTHLDQPLTQNTDMGASIPESIEEVTSPTAMVGKSAGFSSGRIWATATFSVPAMSAFVLNLSPCSMPEHRLAEHQDRVTQPSKARVRVCQNELAKHLHLFLRISLRKRRCCWCSSDPTMM